MISIILSASEETKERALAAGFKEETVLMRDSFHGDSDMSEEELEDEMYKLGPNQFLISNVWGAIPDD